MQLLINFIVLSTILNHIHVTKLIHRLFKFDIYMSVSGAIILVLFRVVYINIFIGNHTSFRTVLCPNAP